MSIFAKSTLMNSAGQHHIYIYIHIHMDIDIDIDTVYEIYENVSLGFLVVSSKV